MVEPDPVAHVQPVELAVVEGAREAVVEADDHVIDTVRPGGCLVVLDLVADHATAECAEHGGRGTAATVAELVSDHAADQATDHGTAAGRLRGGLDNVLAEGRFDRNWKLPADAAAKLRATGAVEVR